MIWVIVLLTLILNVWVWFFPIYFVQIMKFGKNAKVETLFPSLKDVWKVIEHPGYIWAPRIVFGMALIISISVAYLTRR